MGSGEEINERMWVGEVVLQGGRLSEDKEWRQVSVSSEKCQADNFTAGSFNTFHRFSPLIVSADSSLFVIQSVLLLAELIRWVNSRDSLI